MIVSVETHKFSNLTFQVQDAVELPLAAALCCDAVLTPPPNIVNKLKLFRGQFVHFHQHLEVIPWKICDLIYGERQLHLEKEVKHRQKHAQYYSVLNKVNGSVTICYALMLKFISLFYGA